MITHLLVEKHFMPTLIPTLSYSLSRNAPIKRLAALRVLKVIILTIFS
jgi:hypothetical protein